ncbi:hypothetical protein Q6280_28255, partial [Klebsiella pneumoniae]
ARTDQRQGLCDRPALAFQVVGAPQHDGDRLGQRMPPGRMLGQQTLGLGEAVLDRLGAGDAEGV